MKKIDWINPNSDDFVLIEVDLKKLKEKLPTEGDEPFYWGLNPFVWALDWVQEMADRLLMGGEIDAPILGYIPERWAFIRIIEGRHRIGASASLGLERIKAAIPIGDEVERLKILLEP